jgi:uncharacterized RDD family membrane protein YckC
MRNASRVILAMIALGLVSASPAWSLPTPGLYNSTDLGGALLLGRGVTSRACVHTCGGVGDVFNVSSWDGTTLATQWWAKCGIENTAFSVTDQRIGGVGPVLYSSTFTGGSFWFGAGPWGGGGGTLGATYILTTVQYILISGVSTPVASRVNIQTSGVFDDGKCILTFAISNGIGVGETDAPVNNIKPATYPDFMDTGCLPTRIYGSWGDLSQITMMIECPTPVSPSTWGKIKTLYR